MNMLFKPLHNFYFVSCATYEKQCSCPTPPDNFFWPGVIELDSNKHNQSALQLLQAKYSLSHSQKLFRIWEIKQTPLERLFCDVSI